MWKNYIVLITVRWLYICCLAGGERFFSIERTPGESSFNFFLWLASIEIRSIPLALGSHAEENTVQLKLFYFFLFFIWYTLKMSCYLSTALNNIDKNIEIQIIWPNSFSYWVSNKHSLFCNYCYKIARFIFTWEYECLVLFRLPSWY